MSEANNTNNDIPIDLSQLDQLTAQNVIVVSLQTQLKVQKARNLTIDFLESDLS